MNEDPREAYYENRLRHCSGQYAGFDVSSMEAMLSLLYTYDLLHQATGRYMSEYGLSKSSVNILMLLRHGPEGGMQLHELGELLLVSRANITGLIDHLEEKGYVTRSVDPVDRRVRYARITKQADALLDEFIPVHCGKVKGMLQGLSEDEKGTLVRLLKKARAGIWGQHTSELDRVNSLAGLSEVRG